MKKLFTFLTVFILVSLGSAQNITIDGDMSDWDASMQIDIPPNEVEGIGDSIDVDWDGTLDGVINPALDVKDLYVTHDDDYLYVRIDINEDGTFSDLLSLVDGGYQASIELFLDTDCDTSTGLTWGWWYTSGDYWINLSVPYGWPGFEVPHKYGINKFIGSSGTDSQWEALPDDSCMVAVNLDDNKMEIAIPRAAIGETNGDFESTAILSLNEDPTAGWNSDSAPNSVGTERYVYRYGRKAVVVDGDVSEWTEAERFDVAPNEEEGLQDSVDYGWDGTMDDIINPALDIKDVWVSHDDDYLYVRLDINEDGTFTDLESIKDAEGYIAPIQLYFDTDLDSSTGLTWGYWLNGGDYYVNVTNPYGNPGLETTHAYGILKFTGANGTDEQFVETGDSCIVVRNLDDNKMEIAVPRAAIGETNGENESTGILVLAEDPTNDWVNDVAPNDDGSFRNVYNYGRPLGDLTGISTRHIHRPGSFELSQNYPNPFNPTTNISYSLEKSQKITLAIYNVLGQKVRTLVSGQQVAGTHTLSWNGRNDLGLTVPSGIYFYSLKGAGRVLTKKMILIR